MPEPYPSLAKIPPNRPPTHAQQTTPAAVRNGGKAWPAVLAMLILLAIAGGLGVVGYRMWQEPFEPLDTSAVEFNHLAERAQRALGDHQPRRILPDVEAFVARFPDFPLGYRLLGQVWLDIGRGDRDVREHAFEQAQQAWLRSLELDPEQDGLRLLAGDVAVKQGKPDLAEQHFLTLVLRQPENLTYSIRLAFAWINLNRFDEAAIQIDQAIRQDDRRYDGFYFRGVLAGRRALDDRLPVELRDALLTEAIELIDLARDRLAEQIIERRRDYVQVVRHQAGLMRRLSALRGNEPQWAQAAIDLLQPPTLFLNESLDPEVTEELAAACALLDEPVRAAEFFESSIIAHPHDWRLLAGAAQWWIEAGRIDRAQPHLDRLESIGNRRPDLPLLADRLAELRRRFEEEAPIPLDDLLPD